MNVSKWDLREYKKIQRSLKYGMRIFKGYTFDVSFIIIIIKSFMERLYKISLDLKNFNEEKHLIKFWNKFIFLWPKSMMINESYDWK